MPQTDVETLAPVPGGVDHNNSLAALVDGDVLPDQPPESFWLSKDAELDWFDRNAFFDRKDSTKGTNPNNPNPNLNRSHSTTSHRFSVTLKSRASILRLPKPQKACFSDAALRRNPKPPSSACLFPKKSTAPEDKSSMAEPSSPKVSCMGRVRSKKDRSRRCRNRQRAAEPVKKNVRKQRSKLWTSFTGMFRSGSKDKPAVQPVSTYNSPAKEDIKKPNTEPGEPVSPPGLGGVKRFVSGRRSESWGIVDFDFTSEGEGER